jgi:transposase
VKFLLNEKINRQAEVRWRSECIDWVMVRGLKQNPSGERTWCAYLDDGLKVHCLVRLLSGEMKGV